MIATDYFIASIIIFSSLISFIRGFINELFSLIVWIIAIVLSSRYYNIFSNLFVFFEEKIIRNVLSIFLIFLFILIMGSVLSNYLNIFINKIGLSFFNKFLGIFFGIFRGILIVSIFLFFLKAFTKCSSSIYWTNSKLIPYFNYIILWFVKILGKYISFITSIYQ
ncbi:MAG: CvpA family protein [Wigglesworthia glossinidia]|nr:CvpA family protein [Wigglesworthia glossinidia]